MLITRNRTTRDRNFRLYIRMQIWKNILGCQPHTFRCFGSDLRNKDTWPSSDGKNGTVKRRRHITSPGRIIRGGWRGTPTLIARHHGQIGIPAVAVRSGGKSNLGVERQQKDLDAKGANGGDAHSADAFSRSGDARCFLFTRSGGKAGDAEGNSGSRNRASSADYDWKKLVVKKTHMSASNYA